MGYIFVIVITIVGYLFASLCSWSFDMGEWNWFSNIIKWIVIILDVWAIRDTIFNRKDKDRT